MPGHESVVVGLGAAHGFKFAPTFGRLLADLATGKRDTVSPRSRLDRPALTDPHHAGALAGVTGDLARLREEVRARDGTVPAMLPAEAYTSDEVLAWERRHLFAGTWTCLGRLDELLPERGGRSRSAP